MIKQILGASILGECFICLDTKIENFFSFLPKNNKSK